MPAGRPRKKIELKPETVITHLAQIHCSKTEISKILGISVDTFDRHYAELYDKERVTGKTRLRKAMMHCALQDGNVTMMIWLAKNYLGMTDKTSMELTGRDGGPVATTNLNALSNDELHQLELLVAKTATEPGVDPVGTRQAKPK